MPAKAHGGGDVSPPPSVAVIGGGAWGTSLAWLLAGNGRTVRLWLYEKELVDTIHATRENSRYLPGVVLPPSVEPTASLKEAVESCGVVVFVVPSHVARNVFSQLQPHLPSDIPIVIATKGIENTSLLLMTDVLLDVDPQRRRNSLVVLSGPSFAKEVCRRLPTAVTLAGTPALTAKLQPYFTTGTFKVFLSRDMIGVQLGGAVKNVIALAAGGSDGLGFGHNARAALIARGLAEMIRLGRSMGAETKTFYGLSGIGDLILTCTGDLSRNRSVGYQIGQGRPLDQILSQMQMVAEGISTAKAAHQLANRQRVEMPIVNEVHAVLFENKSPRRAFEDLMAHHIGIELPGGG
jgi:glycerol-3-phosphate dehydrogenase (NAD(P)+)